MPIYTDLEIEDIKSAYYWKGVGVGGTAVLLLCLGAGLFLA